MSQPERSAYDVVAAYLQLAPSDRRAVEKHLPRPLRDELKALTKPSPARNRAPRGLSPFIVTALSDEHVMTPAARQAAREALHGLDHKRPRP